MSLLLIGIERNKHQSGRFANIIFGAATIIDGFVRVVSLGFYHTRLPLAVSRWQAKAMIKK